MPTDTLIQCVTQKEAKNEAKKTKSLERPETVFEDN